MVCLGTRPEVIKLAPVIARLEREAGLRATKVTTAQHREMLDQMLDTFGITPDVDLGLMRPRQDLADLAGRAIPALARTMTDHRPDAVLVQGDTTTAFCAALAAFYTGIPVGHVEAGLRSGNPSNPFPEEVNRRLVAPLARWHFCPTDRSAFNLRSEGTPTDAIAVTGNTVIDAVTEIADRPLTAAQKRCLPPKLARRRVLVTLHRRETQGGPQRELGRALARVADRFDDLELLFPLHLSPAVRESLVPVLDGRSNVRLTEALDYPVLVHALRTSDVVVTDSGGIQEEAPAFGIPVLVARDTTERPEGVDAGCARLVGTDGRRLEEEVSALLADGRRYRTMAQAPNPYGDGRAAERIVRRLAGDLSSARRSGTAATGAHLRTPAQIPIEKLAL